MSIDQLVLGTMYFGTRVEQGTAHDLMDRFVDAGGRMIDTADAYSFWTSESGRGGQSEECVGEWLTSRPGMRSRVELATKVGAEPDHPFDGEIRQTVGLGRDHVRSAVEASLRRLRTDVVDVYWAHVPDERTPVEEVARTFGEVVAEGSARRVGMSNFPVWQVERARAVAAAAGLQPVDALQLHTSYVSPRPGAAVPGKDNPYGWVGVDTLSYLDAHPGTELWVYSPLVQASYTRRAERPFPEAYDHPGTTARLAVLDAVADESGLDAGQVVLTWMLARGWRPIIGVSTAEQLESALVAARAELAPEQLERLDAPA